MTQKTYSVSPKPSVRLKPGIHLPGLRPSDSGDTRAPVARPTTAGKPATTEEVLPLPARLSATHPAASISSARSRSTSRQRSGLRRSHVALPGRPRAFCFAVPIRHPINQKSEIRKSEIRTLVSPLLYRTFSRCTAKPTFSFFLFFLPSCANPSNPSTRCFAQLLSFGLCHSFVICALVICHFPLFPKSLRRPACAGSLRRFSGQWKP